MDNQKNSILGHKVFFLNLSVDVEDRLISFLRKKEYEVYVLDDFRYAKNTLEAFPDSIFYVQIDSHEKNHLNTNQWFNFLNSFKENENLSQLIMGVLSKRMSTAEQNFFILNLPLNAGMITIHDTVEKLQETILEVLDLNGAKGRRQFVRARCPEDTNDYVKCNVQGQDFTLRINDISCAGISCYVPVQQSHFFQPNAVIKSLTLGLGMEKPVTCSAAIFAVKPLNEKYSLLVVLIMPTTAQYVKDFIRDHVYVILENQLDAMTFSKPMDETEYSDKLPSRDDMGFLIEADEDEKEV